MSARQSLSFTETMRGFYSLSDQKTPLVKDEFTTNYDKGKSSGNGLDFTLTIEIDDLDEFCKDPKLEARAVGVIKIDSKSYPVEKGIFNLFIRPNASQSLNEVKEMNYTLFFKDDSGKDKTFFGYKMVEREDGVELWAETTTLYTYIWDGHKSYEDGIDSVEKVGVLRIYVDDFIDQLKSMEVSGSNIIDKTKGVMKFAKIFSGNLWEAYAPMIFNTDSRRWREHIFPLETTVGVNFKEIRKYDFHTDDGIVLHLQRFKNNNSKNIVLLLHGMTNSTDMYMMPEIKNIISYLGDNGIDDIWSLDWRGGYRYKYNTIPNRYTLDDVITYDIPAAIETIKKNTSEDVNIHVIGHCVGSITAMSSIAAGKMKNVKSMISNSVSLTPKVTPVSKLKLAIAPTLFEYILGYPYISASMAYYPGPGFGKWITWFESLIRRECRESSCHMLSFMWGFGFPACYEHHNISPITHRRIPDLFGEMSMNYYRHIKKMVYGNNMAMPYSRKGPYADLPETYLGNLKNIEMPNLLLVSGDNNKIFPGSNKLTYDRIKSLIPDANVVYEEFKNYGHMDVVIGKNAYRDTFPRFLQFLKENFS